MEKTHKIRTSFKTLASKKVAKWRLKKFQSNDKLSQKVMSFSYHIVWKTFTEASCTNNIHTGEKTFCSATFKGLWVISCKKTRGILRSVWVYFAFLEVRRQKILLERGKFSFLYVDVWFDVMKCKCIVKNNSFEMLVVFSPVFVADTKITFIYNFVAPLRFSLSK